MRWHAQVAHVVRKDLYLSRWLLLAYVVVVLGTTAVAVGWQALGTEPSPLWRISLVLLGMVLLALLVQADSPERSNAFWVTLPLHRSAVFAAKVAGAVLLLLVLPLLGQAAGLSAHAVAIGDLPVLLARSALEYGAWLGLAAVIAALTPDLRTFTVALVLVMLGGLLSTLVLHGLAGPMPSSAPPARLLKPALVVGAALSVLAYLYHTRNVRRGAWIAALLGIPIHVLPPGAGIFAPTVTPASGSIPESLRPSTLDVSEVQFLAGDRTELYLELSGVSASHQYLLVWPVANLAMSDGTSARVKIQTGQAIHLWLNDPTPRLGKGVTWLGEREPARVFNTGVAVDLSLDQRAALARGDARLTVSGHLEVREARIQEDLPLEAGATAVFDRRRVRILKMENIRGRPTMELQVSSVASPRSPGGAEPLNEHPRRRHRHALLNQESNEAIALTEGSGSGSGFGLVLPGAQTWTMTRVLQPDPSVQVSDEWLRNARLLLLDWVPVGSDPVLIQATAPDAGTQRRGSSM